MARITCVPLSQFGNPRYVFPRAWHSGMSAPQPRRTVTLFVRAEPGSSGPRWDSVGSTGLRMASMVVPGIGLRARRPDPSAPTREDGMEIPYGQAQCVRLVRDLAERAGYVVEVVDVTAPGVSLGEVERRVGTGGVYPILVRPDGSWIEGEENFTPSRVRKFLK